MAAEPTLEQQPLWLLRHGSQEAIHLAKPSQTPGGHRITRLLVWVDILYAIRGNAIVVYEVKLSPPGAATLEGCNCATLRGEAFRINSVTPQGELLKVALKDLEANPSMLGRVMLRTWRETYPKAKTPFLPEPFTVYASCEACGEIEKLFCIESLQMVCADCKTAIGGT